MKGNKKGQLLRKPESLNKRFTKKKLEAIRNSQFLLKKDEEVRKALDTKEFQDFLKKYPTRENPKSLVAKTKSEKKASSKSNPRKLKRFTKAQLESIRNSPMFVRKQKAAEEFFSSPGYKAYEREREEQKETKGVKKKS